MGFNVENIAVFGKTPQAIFQEASLTATHEFVDFPDDPICGARLPSGAFGLYLNAPVFDESIIKKLSNGASIFRLEVSETVMTTSLSALVDGQEVWSIWHDGGYQGPEHLATSGPVPEIHESILAEQTALLDTDDQVDFIFEVPVKLFVALGGFRYDEDLPVDDPKPWEILQHHSPQPSWFARIWRGTS
ncbi:hypothetical protein DTL42_08690 [Bremerella cremea]|uniref:Uncharacterized protein n=1 Tax=Bremerella cremea TaxID=1031537 RepID=A0A368KTC8_9BACT|nr:hypothetical protein [Bremerella cremea]RCS52895.1 hypothetical protein DTL42_08690 [Bremerella cremea]